MFHEFVQSQKRVRLVHVQSFLERKNCFNDKRTASLLDETNCFDEMPANFAFSGTSKHRLNLLTIYSVIFKNFRLGKSTLDHAVEDKIRSRIFDQMVWN